MEIIAGALLGTTQNQSHHVRELRLAEELKEAELAQAQRFHVEEMQQGAELFKLHDSNQWQMHHDSMHVAMDLARRETMRDVWQQRQALNQTILVVDALMFSSAFIAITQPQFPETQRPSSWYFGVYGIGLGVATTALALSMWASFKVQSRMGGYNVNRVDLVYGCGNLHPDFNSYFSCHCEGLRLMATASFLLGTVAVLVGAAGAQLIQAEHAFNDIAVGVIFAVIVIVSAVVVILLELFANDKCDGGSSYGGLDRTHHDKEADTDPHAGDFPAVQSPSDESAGSK
jgi:hypothetical protein